MVGVLAKRARYRRSIFASAMIGGGWDGWEYSNDDHNI